MAQIMGSSGGGPTDHLNQPVPSSSLEGKVQGKGADEEHDESDAQEVRSYRQRMAEDMAEPDPHPRPDESAHYSVADEAPDARVDSTGHPGRDRIQLGQESSAQLEDRKASRVDALRPRSQDSCRWGEPAEDVL
jgi:hypothetical protein